jgi:hypothetical protein
MLGLLLATAGVLTPAAHAQGTTPQYLLEYLRGPGFSYIYQDSAGLAALKVGDGDVDSATGFSIHRCTFWRDTRTGDGRNTQRWDGLAVRSGDMLTFTLGTVGFMISVPEYGQGQGTFRAAGSSQYGQFSLSFIIVN